MVSMLEQKYTVRLTERLTAVAKGKLAEFGQKTCVVHGTAFRCSSFVGNFEDRMYLAYIKFKRLVLMNAIAPYIYLKDICQI